MSVSSRPPTMPAHRAVTARKSATIPKTANVRATTSVSPALAETGTELSLMVAVPWEKSCTR